MWTPGGGGGGGGNQGVSLQKKEWMFPSEMGSWGGGGGGGVVEPRDFLT